MPKTITLSSLICVVVCISAMPTPAVASAQAPSDCTESITVFQDVSKFGRKDRAASNMTRLHQEMAAEGWVFRDMEVYTENGDLEGFYLTYSRAAQCAPLQAPGQD